MKMKLVKITKVHPSSSWNNPILPIVGSNVIIWNEEIIGKMHLAYVYFVTGPFRNGPHTDCIYGFEYEELL